MNKTQLSQEEEYNFPYHYLDLKVDMYKEIYHIEYLSKIKNIISNINKKFEILDVGCGDGRHCYELTKNGFDVEGVDYSKRAIKFAEAFNPQVKFYFGDINKLKVQKKYDCILLLDVLEHFIPSNIPNILNSLDLLLKPNGILIISVPTLNQKLSSKHYQHFSKKILKKILIPTFYINNIFGVKKKGFHRHIFSNLKRLGYYLFPLKYKFKVFNYYFKFLKKYYSRHLSKGKPDNCYDLIAICKKAKKIS